MTLDTEGKGLLVVISGPSGVGKSTVCEKIVQSQGYKRVTTATTRAPKKGETPGKDYHFLSPEEFQKGIDEGEFLEYSRVYGVLYGTPAEGVREILQTGNVALLVIDVQGARLVKRTGIPALYIMLAPASERVLLERLSARGREDEKERSRRLAEANRELQAKNEFDYVVVNDHVDRAVSEIVTLVEKWRTFHTAES